MFHSVNLWNLSSLNVVLKTPVFHDATTQIAGKIVDLLQVDLTSFLASGARFLGREAASDEVAKSAKDFFESLENQWLWREISAIFPG